MTPEEIAAAEQRKKNAESRAGALRGFQDIVGYVQPEDRPQRATEPDKPQPVGFLADGTPEFEASGTGGVPSTAPADETDRPLSINRTNSRRGRPTSSPDTEGAGSGFKATISGEFGPQVPGEYTAALFGHMRNSAALRVLDSQARADSFGVMADIAGTLQDRQAEEIVPVLDEVNSILDEAELEKDAIGELIDEAKSIRVNPGQFFANVGAAGTFASALAVGAGAMASAFGGGPNAALGIITRAIDRNVRAQIANQHHARSVAALQMNFVHTIRGLAKDRIAQADYLNMAYTSMAKASIERARNRYLEANSRLAAQDVVNQLGIRLTQLEIDRITASRAKAEFKVNSLLGVAKAQRFFQGGGAQPTGPALASRGRGKQPRAAQAVELTPEQLQDPRGIANAIKEQIQNSGASPEQARAMLKEATQKYGTDPNVAREIEAIVPEDVADKRTVEGFTLSAGGKQFDVDVIDPALWNNLKPQQQVEARGQLTAAHRMLDSSVNVYNMLAVANQTSNKEGIMRYLRTYGSKRFGGPATDENAAKAFTELAMETLAIEQALQEAKQGRNAINTAAEMVRIALEAGSNVGALDQIADWMLKSKELRQMRYEPAVRFFEKRTKDMEAQYGVRTDTTLGF